MLPVEDPRNEKPADYMRDRWELGYSRWDVQAAVNEVAEGVHFILKVLLDSGVHILQFFNWKACGAHFCRIKVADFCFELRGDISFYAAGLRYSVCALTWMNMGSQSFSIRPLIFAASKATFCFPWAATSWFFSCFSRPHTSSR